MPRAPHFFPLACIGFVLLLAGCSRAQDTAQQAPAPPPVAATPAHMADHFGKVREIEEAIIRGDLDAAKTPALWIADHQDATDRQGTERPVREMRAAAKSVATADNIDNAAIAAATMLGACGSCHAAAKVSPKMPPLEEATAKAERARHMLEHQHAMDLMYRGLIAPVSGDWRKGAEALKVAPLRDKALKDIDKEAAAAEARGHELAERAINAPDQSSRVTIYGSLMASCASCHGLHGRIWGPGLPKTQ